MARILPAAYGSLLVFVLSTRSCINGWTTTTLLVHSFPRQQQQTLSCRFAGGPETVLETTTITDEDAPAGIQGAQFFGGNKEKEEFYDPVAEGQASIEKSEVTIDRFRVSMADETAEAVARSVQMQINQILYDSKDDSSVSKTTYTYASNLLWSTPLQSAKSRTSIPLLALEESNQFYQKLSVAVTGGRSMDTNQVLLYWEISVIWPIFWESRVLLTGSSVLTVNENNEITKQVDTLDEPNLLTNLVRQWLPRFWDVYHIGMTPSCEQSPKLVERRVAGGYTIYTVPARWYAECTLQDLSDRTDNVASTIPNHAFGCVIKTMGPQKQDYTPCVPVQVQIQAMTKTLTWHIPIAVETLAKNSELVVPGPDEEIDTETVQQPTSGFCYQPRRRVATLAYGGYAQDERVAVLRKQLYQTALQQGYTPKLDANGRPMFFFWQNAVKACYTDEGLGMAVYEWRPKWTKPNEIGIELEL
jgi:hypothetical protein